jgi:hypothetical protein
MFAGADAFMVIAIIALAAGMVGAGSLVVALLGGNSYDSAANLVTGWAAISTTGTICALAGARLTAPFAIAAFAGIAGLVLSDRRHAAAAAACLLATPLLFIASAVPPVMSDEFAHWLPNARILVETDAFPTIERKNVWSQKPGYPPAMPLIGYIARCPLA